MKERVFKKKKFKVTKELIWKGIIIISSVLLIMMSFAPLLLIK